MQLNCTLYALTATYVILLESAFLARNSYIEATDVGYEIWEDETVSRSQIGGSPQSNNATADTSSNGKHNNGHSLSDDFFFHSKKIKNEKFESVDETEIIFSHETPSQQKPTRDDFNMSSLYPSDEWPHCSKTQPTEPDPSIINLLSSIRRVFETEAAKNRLIELLAVPLNKLGNRPLIDRDGESISGSRYEQLKNDSQVIQIMGQGRSGIVMAVPFSLLIDPVPAEFPDTFAVKAINLRYKKDLHREDFFLNELDVLKNKNCKGIHGGKNILSMTCVIQRYGTIMDYNYALLALEFAPLGSLRSFQLKFRWPNSKGDRNWEKARFGSDFSFNKTAREKSGSSATRKILSPLPLPLIRSFLIDLLVSLRFLAENGVQHRDIKGHNLLIYQDEFEDRGIVRKVLRLKLADFGLAKLREFVHNTGRMKNLQEIAGTRRYMAPEIRERNWKPPIAEMWSVGVVFHEMLYGTSPKLEMIDDVWHSFIGTEAHMVDTSRSNPFYQAIPSRLKMPKGVGKADMSRVYSMFDMLVGLLQVSPNNRLPLEVALVHPFIVGYDPVDRWVKYWQTNRNAKIAKLCSAVLSLERNCDDSAASLRTSVGQRFKFSEKARNLMEASQDDTDTNTEWYDYDSFIQQEQSRWSSENFPPEMVFNLRPYNNVSPFRNNVSYESEHHSVGENGNDMDDRNHPLDVAYSVSRSENSFQDYPSTHKLWKKTESSNRKTDDKSRRNAGSLRKKYFSTITSNKFMNNEHKGQNDFASLNQFNTNQHMSDWQEIKSASSERSESQRRNNRIEIQADIKLSSGDGLDPLTPKHSYSNATLYRISFETISPGEAPQKDYFPYPPRALFYRYTSPFTYKSKASSDRSSSSCKNGGSCAEQYFGVLCFNITSNVKQERVIERLKTLVNVRLPYFPLFTHIYGYVRFGTRIIFIMEHKPDLTRLGDRISSVKSLSVPKTRILAHDVALLLVWMHHHRIAHRNLKPSSLLIENIHHRVVASYSSMFKVYHTKNKDKDRDGFLVLSDGRVLESSQVGTPFYMAPEIDAPCDDMLASNSSKVNSLASIKFEPAFCDNIDGSKLVIPAPSPHDPFVADLWSYGAILYRLLHGYAPLAQSIQGLTRAKLSWLKACVPIPLTWFSLRWSKDNFNMAADMAHLIASTLFPKPSNRSTLIDIMYHRLFAYLNYKNNKNVNIDIGDVKNNDQVEHDMEKNHPKNEDRVKKRNRGL